MAEELHAHREHYVNDLVKAGVPIEEARRRASLEFGSVNRIQEECREARRLHLWDELWRELRYAWRLLRKTPGFAFTALFTIALCFGANLIVFSVIDSILLRPLPFPHASRLVSIFNTYPKAGVLRDGSSLTNYYERRGHLSAFSSLSIYRLGSAIVGKQGSTERTEIAFISPDFFTTLSRGPVMGRPFSEAETTYRSDGVVILTDAYWREHLEANPHILGHSVRVDGNLKTIVGVLPPSFVFLSSKPRLYLPLSSAPEQRAPLQRHSGGNVTQMIARLAPGFSVKDAQSQIDLQNHALERDDPQGKQMAEAGFRSLVVSLHADQVASIRPVSLLLQAAVLVLLLIGLVNLVNLLLVRANGRVKELAVRQALGASSRHLISEVTVETVLLTSLGALLGCLLAAAGMPLLNAWGANRLPLGSALTFDARLAVVSFVGAVLMAIVLAAPIVWFHLHSALPAALSSETRGGTTGQGAQTLRHAFLVAQITLAFVLLSGAGLLTLSLGNALAVAPGFEADHVLSARISLPSRTYPKASTGLAFAQRITAALENQPAVLAAGVVNNIPFSGNDGKSAAAVKGHVARPGESPRGHYSYGVAGDYFRALGFSLRAGRFLNSADTDRARRVCVVDEDFARYYWPHTNPIGQRLFQGSEQAAESEAFTVVGVVGGVKQAGLTAEEAQGAVYYPYAFRPSPDFFVVARTRVAPEHLALTLQTTVRRIDPDLPVADVESMDARISDSLVVRRSPALLALLFALVAVLLTAVGVYGVLSYAIGQRRREIGVRMALGALPQQIRSQFLSLGLKLLSAGTLLGILGAWLAGRAMQSVLFHVPALQLGVLALCAGLLGAVCLVACWLPSRRAARISPLEALQTD